MFPPAAMALPDALVEDRRARDDDAAWMLARFVCPASAVGRIAEERALSVVVDSPAEVPRDLRIEAVETRAAPDGFAGEVYVEGQPLDSIAAAGLQAKARCTDISVEELAEFVRGCRERGLVFKATAGLHHAVRGDHGHGFLNLLAACVFGDEEAALRDDDFALDADSFRWGHREAGPDECVEARRFLNSIGSCSYFELVGELRAMGIL